MVRDARLRRAPHHEAGRVRACPMIDHVSIAVRDLDAAARFYEAVLARIGYAKLEVRPKTVAFGKRHGELWLNHRPEMFAIPEGDGAHVCLRAPTPAAVDAFHPAARAAGRPAAGAPGLGARHGEWSYAGCIPVTDGL